VEYLSAQGLDFKLETFPHGPPCVRRPQAQQHDEVAFNVVVSHDAGHGATLLALPGGMIVWPLIVCVLAAGSQRFSRRHQGHTDTLVGEHGYVGNWP
jgi:hypothetical protein